MTDFSDYTLRVIYRPNQESSRMTAVGYMAALRDLLVEFAVLADLVQYGTCRESVKHAQQAQKHVFRIREISEACRRYSNGMPSNYPPGGEEARQAFLNAASLADRIYEQIRERAKTQLISEAGI